MYQTSRREVRGFFNILGSPHDASNDIPPIQDQIQRRGFDLDRCVMWKAYEDPKFPLVNVSAHQNRRKGIRDTIPLLCSTAPLDDPILCQHLAAQPIDLAEHHFVCSLYTHSHLRTLRRSLFIADPIWDSGHVSSVVSG